MCSQAGVLLGAGNPASRGSQPPMGLALPRGQLLEDLCDLGVSGACWGRLGPSAQPGPVRWSVCGPEPMTPGPAPEETLRVCVLAHRLAPRGAGDPLLSVWGAWRSQQGSPARCAAPPSSWPFEVADSFVRVDNLISAQPVRFGFSLSLPAALWGGSC